MGVVKGEGQAHHYMVFSGCSQRSQCSWDFPSLPNPTLIFKKLFSYFLRYNIFHIFTLIFSIFNFIFSR